jgi:hypothetical protein
MILRRLADAIHKQSWFTVFVELVLIITGVFLGIQVNNWNEARLDRQQEAEVLERLIADFRGIESDALARAYSSVRRTEALRTLALQLNETNETPDITALSALLLRGTAGSSPRGGSATYVELLSTGRLGLIQSETLREALSNYAERHAVSESVSRLNWDVAIQNGRRLMELTALGVFGSSTRETSCWKSACISHHKISDEIMTLPIWRQQELCSSS